MDFIKLAGFIVLFNLSVIFVDGQSPGDACPVVAVTGPFSVLNEGEPMTFSAEVKGLPEGGNLNFNWTVNYGAIISGQGTNTITVSTEGLAGQSVAATVVVKGDNFSDECDTTVSETGVVAGKITARLIDRMTNANCEDRQARMDNFFVELSNDPAAAGYIFSFGSPRAVAAVEKRMRANIRWRRFDPTRMTLVNGGGKSKKATIEFWLVPAGADAPTPEPPVENEADFDTAETDAKIETGPKEPFIFSAEYYDGGGCVGEDTELDLEGFARKLKENPKARGNIVIILTTKAEFREKQKEILNFLTRKGIDRRRLRTFHQKTFGGVELWLLP